MSKRLIPFCSSLFCFLGLCTALYSTELHSGYYMALGLVFGFVFTSILKDKVNE